jgi:hypothetical protein
MYKMASRPIKMNYLAAYRRKLNGIISLVNGTGKGKKMPVLFVCFYIIVFIWILVLVQSVTNIVLPI